MENVTAGKITRTFGKEGEVLAVLYDSFPARYDTREPLWVVIDSLAVPLFISRFERRGRGGALMVFDDIDNERRTALVTGLEFAVSARQAKVTARPDNDLSRLVGYTALITEEEGGQQEISGRIEEIEGNDSNPLFLILSGQRELLIPAAGDLIAGIDPERKTIRLQVPTGLLDL